MSTTTMNARPVNARYTEKRRRREQQVRTQKNIIYTVLVAIVVLLIVTICVKLFNTPDRAEASLSGYYSYESIIISDGETIWTIAENHKEDYTGSLKEYVNEIISVNGLENDILKAGDSLVIPVYVRAK